MLTMLRAFNVGAGQPFANGFVADRPLFEPYTAEFRQYVTRKEIAPFVVQRSGAGDGWTALELLPPQGTVGLPGVEARGRLSYRAARAMGRPGRRAARLALQASA